ncbi:unnamed protein product [Cuscuta campestris]|uniref:F-box domain-containing protein n=1 Tax=Cuscuta campestris TaxID=132261 RepID=A0A484N5S1_9ASTE|nr:unnamed protein product [Cuscuta campestris]
MERGRRDRFGELPAEVLDMILGFLPIVDAARMAVLSSLWKDSWFSLSNLCFDLHFFSHIDSKYFSYYCDSDIRDKRVIYDNENIDILVSVLKKFALVFTKKMSSYCRTASFHAQHSGAVEFEPNGLLGHTIEAPMLEDLSFYACSQTMFYFNVNAPKLCTLTIQSCSYNQNIGYLPDNSTFLENVRTLVLDPFSIMYFLKPFSRSGISLQRCELNVECLKLLDDPLHCDPEREWVVYHDISFAFIRLLQICPKLCKLHMHIQVVEVVANCLKRDSELSKELYCVAQTLNLLHTLRA